MQGEKKSSNAWKTISGILAVLLLISIFTNGFGGTTKKVSEVASSFTEHENAPCTIEGKPVIRLFSTTWCPHCQWISSTFEKVVGEYVEQGKIVAHHWELDNGDDTLTSEIENEIPVEELSVYKQFNPGGSIPTFVFGCKYSRVGNGYESEGNQGLIKEEAEFRLLIEELLR